MAPDTPVPNPFPISCIAGRYLLFDPPTIAHARRTHNITGVLIGTIPNLSQQNIFLGIPLELTPEEARVLVEQSYAYIVDDAEVHRQGFLEMKREDRLKLLRDLDEQGMRHSREIARKAEERSEQALKEKGITTRTAKRDAPIKQPATERESNAEGKADADTSLFNVDTSPTTKLSRPPQSEKKLDPTFFTPTTSHPPLPLPQPSSPLPLPAVPRSYPLFKLLHTRGYFMMPGLRFGCHYSVYPGDPLRFHSHFLATGLGWDEEFELLDVIGGGRLGSGVKKAYLIGGEADSTGEDGGKEGVRAFSIEWAGL